MQRITMRLAALALVCAAAVAYAPRAEATSAFAALNVEELTKRASDVVVGRVTDFSSRVEGNQIFTYVNVRVTGVWKDGGHAKQTITVRMLGGTAAGLRMRVIGAPCFRRDEEVVLFLAPDANKNLGVINLAEGKFRVVRERTGARVERDLSGIEFTQTNPVKVPELLKDLEQLVRNSAR